MENVFCPYCKHLLKYIEPKDDEERNENYICPKCDALWLICYEGQKGD